MRGLSRRAVGLAAAMRSQYSEYLLLPRPLVCLAPAVLLRALPIRRIGTDAAPAERELPVGTRIARCLVR